MHCAAAGYSRLAWAWWLAPARPSRFGFLFPESSSATALFEVRIKQESIIRDSIQQSTQDYEILKKTQLALLKSKFLLTSALRDPGIAALSILAGERDKEEWLQEHLDVEFPQNGEILSISLTGTPADDLVLLVDKVAEAYKTEVLGNETARKLNIHDMVERSLQNLQTEIKRKSEDYIDIAKGMNRTTAEQIRDPETDLLIRDIADTQNKIQTLTSALFQLQTDYLVAKAELSDPALFEIQAEEALKMDQKYLYWKYQLDQAEIIAASDPSERQRRRRAARAAIARSLKRVVRSSNTARTSRKRWSAICKTNRTCRCSSSPSGSRPISARCSSNWR